MELGNSVTNWEPGENMIDIIGNLANVMIVSRFDSYLIENHSDLYRSVYESNYPCVSVEEKTHGVFGLNHTHCCSGLNRYSMGNM